MFKTQKTILTCSLVGAVILIYSFLFSGSYYKDLKVSAQEHILDLVDTPSSVEFISDEILIGPWDEELEMPKLCENNSSDVSDKVVMNRGYSPGTENEFYQIFISFDLHNIHGIKIRQDYMCMISTEKDSKMGCVKKKEFMETIQAICELEQNQKVLEKLTSQINVE